MEVELGCVGAGFVGELLAQVVVRERQHPAVAVRDHERLLRAEQPVRDDERAQRVVGDEPARVADDVRIALVEPDELRRIESCVHARDDREPPAGRHRQVAFREARGVGLVGGEQLIASGQGASFCSEGA